METAQLKKFAQFARRSLMEQVSAKLQRVLLEDSPARREHPQAINKLEEAIREHGQDQVIERVAYIWFNRFCALRFMDVNRYTRIGVVSPAEDQFQPEILAEAKMGHVDEETVPEKTRQQIFALLDGKAPSRDPQGEAYRLLLVAACNAWNKAMPFLFQRIDDYTELLMPDDLLSENSILAATREAMTPEACEDVEVIGWLYQFYISEKKDEVFDGLKKNQKITPENIPAATQLFTPHWIVRYLVENSLGRLWLLNRPNSKLAAQMDYYIKPADGDQAAETDFLRISKPEEIKICDPACGSGHMLTYAFDLLYAIYEEEGYEPAEIPEKILTNNLFGIEIDERAGELAAFALIMKAVQYDKRFFRRPAARGKLVEPNICVLQNIHFADDELTEYTAFVGRDLFTIPLQRTLKQFEEADNFGSLIRPDVTDVDGMLRILESKNVSGQLFISMTHQKVLQALRQADTLSPKYHVVIANPPYMGSKGGMNARLAAWGRENYPETKFDLFAMFIERNLQLVTSDGLISMITMQSWMFNSSYERFREGLLRNKSIQNIAHIGPRGFDSIGGEIVTTVAFVVKKAVPKHSLSCAVRLVDGSSEREKDVLLKEAITKRDWNFHIFNGHDLLGIPGSPISYWVSHEFRSIFSSSRSISEVTIARQGLVTAANDIFVRLWFEVSFQKVGFGFKDRTSASKSGKKWFPYNKGGEFRKWYGNNEHIVNWENDGKAIKDKKEKDLKAGRITANNSKCWNQEFYFKPSISWSGVSSSRAAFREYKAGSIFSGAGLSAFFEPSLKNIAIASLNSHINDYLLGAISPGLSLTSGELGRLPFLERPDKKQVGNVVNDLIGYAVQDWDSYETSWDFTTLTLLNPDYRQSTLKASYQKLRTHWREMTLETQRLEEENNRIFIEAYGLQDELTPEVPLNEITLTCNPHYRYGNDKSEDDLEALLLADTLRELVSYAVGCMFGRYALDKPGLILANQSETLADYLNQVPEPSFPADADNVIPLLDGDWFTDDIAERFKQFLRVAFGEEHYEDNLRFVEQGLNIKGKRNYSIRDYFLGEFYTDHVRRYKKRPIYWLFSSPKGSFNALIYMHRYRPDTVSVVLNDYLREFRTKLTAHKSHLEAVSISGSASQAEKTRALKEIESLRKIIDELDGYERDILYPLATEQVEIDLDDGVKVNYPKFGAALKKIVGLDAPED